MGSSAPGREDGLRAALRVRAVGASRHTRSGRSRKAMPWYAWLTNTWQTRKSMSTRSPTRSWSPNDAPRAHRSACSLLLGALQGAVCMQPQPRRTLYITAFHVPRAGRVTWWEGEEMLT